MLALPRLPGIGARRRRPESPPMAAPAIDADRRLAKALALLDGLLVAAFDDPEQLGQSTVSGCTRLLCTAGQPEAFYQRAITLLAALLYARPDLEYDAAPDAVATLLLGGGLTDATHRAASGLLELLVTSSAGPHATTVVLRLLARPSRLPALHEYLIGVLHQIQYWAISSFVLPDLLALAECKHLSRYRLALLAGPIERALFAEPAAMTLPILDRLMRLYGAEPSIRYCLYYLSQLSCVTAAVREAAAGALSGRFALHGAIFSLLRTGARRVLVVQNIADAQGDEIVRCMPLLEALFAGNPALEVVLVTARAYLYAHPRLTVISFEGRSNLRELPWASFDGIIDFFEPEQQELNHAVALERQLQAAIYAAPPTLFLAANKGRNHFVYHTLDLHSQPYASKFGLDRQRETNVYETTFRLIAELGLPLRAGEMPPTDATPLSALPCPEAMAAWSSLLERNAEGLPVALVNGFGGSERLKGFVEQTFPALVREVRALLAAGYFVVLLPNGTPWGSTAQARQLLAQLVPEENARVALGPDPAEGSGSVTFAAPAAMTVPYASAIMRLFSYWVRYADYIVTVEGWMVHAAGILGKRYLLLMPPHASTGAWRPYGSTRSQDVRQGPRGPADAPRRLTRDAPPLPSYPEKHALLFVLRALGSHDDARLLPALRQAVWSEDWALRQAAAASLSRFSGQEIDAELEALLEDQHHAVRAAAARGLLARGSTISSTSRAELLAYQYMGETPPDWTWVQLLADAARPSVRRALHDEDPVMRREAAITLRALELLSYLRQHAEDA